MAEEKKPVHANQGLIGGEVPMGKLDPLKMAVMPAFLGVLAYIGPGILWAALAQGSGELIWWPYLTAKYGAVFLGLLIPASLLQYWINLEIMRYVILTGETPMTGFTRIGRWYAIIIFIGIFIENAWFGAYAAAGGTALGSLTQFPAGWSPGGRALFWGYLTIGIYIIALTFGKVVYNVVEKFSFLIVLLTVGGVIAALFQPKVYSEASRFLPALLPHFSWPSNWDPKDLGILVTSIAYAGAGGFGQLFIGYWMRDKGAGMGKLIGRITSPITGEAEAIPATGYTFQDTAENKKNYKGWTRYIASENFIGIFLNTLTTVLMCWLAWALLLPEHKVPKGWEIAVVQSAFFEVAWGRIGKAIFLVVAAAFLCDAWLQLTDGFSRVWADFVYSNVKAARKYHFRTWYYIFVAVFSMTTIFTMLLAQPGKLMVIRGVCSFLAMSIFAPGLIYLNYYLVPKAFPQWVQPHPINKVIMYLCTASYVLMSLAYLYLVIGGKM
ncbi:MAG TPA: Nramp family divalent metal transporter [Candidatus Methylomirabilis sp.]